jgi:hypothetical protein
VEPQTEADPAALLLQLLACVGNAAGRHCYFRVEATQHYPNLFVCVVGRTAMGRKGTSLDRALWIMNGAADQYWLDECIKSGLASGEGLIEAVRDERWEKNSVRKGGVVQDESMVLADEGVKDKRLLVLETEFASVLTVAGREGNTLSPLLRQAFETGRLRNMSRNKPAKATGAHISMIGHITPEEMRATMTALHCANGSGNRFMYALSRRSKVLPEGGGEVLLGDSRQRLARAIQFGQQPREYRREEAATKLWREIYKAQGEESPGLLGIMTSRAYAHIIRLSLVYAILDESSAIGVEHLRAALAVWDYCKRSAAYLFGTSTGDDLADRILEALRAAGEHGLTGTGLQRHFRNNLSAGKLREALTLLAENGLAHWRKEKTGKRPRTTWFYGPEPTKKTNNTKKPAG